LSRGARAGACRGTLRVRHSCRRLGLENPLSVPSRWHLSSASPPVPARPVSRRAGTNAKLLHIAAEVSATSKTISTRKCATRPVWHKGCERGGLEWIHHTRRCQVIDSVDPMMCLAMPREQSAPLRSARGSASMTLRRAAPAGWRLLTTLATENPKRNQPARRLDRIADTSDPDPPASAPMATLV
jgi:hypothetical protein